jgi:hypothetical protein
VVILVIEVDDFDLGLIDLKREPPVLRHEQAPSGPGSRRPRRHLLRLGRLRRRLLLAGCAAMAAILPRYIQRFDRNRKIPEGVIRIH